MRNCKKNIRIVALTLLCAFVFTFTVTCEAKAATLSKAEKKKFSKYLQGGIVHKQYGSYYKSKKQGILYSAQFFVYDINNDGHKDVIVSGALGLRTMTFSEIYMHVDGKYKVIPIRGTLNGVSSKGLNVIENDYSGAGAERYHSRIAYKFDKHGNITAEHSYNIDTLFYDVSTNTEYKKGKILSKKYLDANGKKISKSTYKKTLQQTNKKKNVKMHEITKANIKKYLK